MKVINHNLLQSDFIILLNCALTVINPITSIPRGITLQLELSKVLTLPLSISSTNSCSALLQERT